MSKSSQILREVRAGDLIFVAASRKDPVEWIDLALICNQDVLRTIHLGDGSSKVVCQSIVEYLEHEGRPIGIFRQYNTPPEKCESFADEMLRLLAKPPGFWARLCGLFKESASEFDWDNKKSIKLMLLEYFHKPSIRQLEESGMFVRLM